MPLPPIFTKLRWAAIIWTMLCVVWLSLEEHSVVLVLALACAGVGIGLGIQTARLANLRLLAEKHPVLYLPMFGLFLGLGTSVGSALLMFFKTAMHAHPIPDYSLQQMLAMLERAPAWALSGALLGLAGALLLLAMRRSYRSL